MTCFWEYSQPPFTFLDNWVASLSSLERPPPGPGIRGVKDGKGERREKGGGGGTMITIHGALTPAPTTASKDWVK